MADELNIPTHRWYQRQNNVQFAKQDMSKQWIYASGIARLLSSTAIYAANGFNPEMVLDFAGETYFVDSSTTTFDSAITHAATTNATMVDSDGLLKWRPHNLIRYSEDLANAAWTKTDVTVSGSTFTAAAGTTIFPRTSLATVGTTADNIWHTITVNATEGTYAYLQITTGASPEHATFDLSTASVGAVHPSATASIVAKGDGSYDCTLNLLVTGTNDRPVIVMAASAAAARYAAWSPAGTETFDVNHVEYYRSDLGGMVNNPDRGDSYVPTTSAARYLPRRGHHVYNGSEWVNEGLLHESDARTQLLHTTDALVTQSKTVTAVPHTLHFTGTGTVTLSGASTSGPLVGTGTGEENRVSLTFTPTAASLTLTVSGTVTDAQLEVGSTPSSYIPNLAASGEVTRAAETLTVPAANMPWPTPVVIGEELVTGDSSTFTTGFGDWAYYTGATATADGVFAIGSTGTYVLSGVLTVGKMYQVEFDWTRTNTSNVPYVGDRAGTASQVRVATGGSLSGRASGIFRCAFNQAAMGSVSGEVTIDNISIKEIDPLSVSIQMDGLMTYADTDVDQEVQWMRWVADANNSIQNYLYTAGADTGTPVFRQVSAGVIDQVTTTSAYSPSINGPFSISSRHGSTFVNGAVDGTALTANTTPTALPDLSATNFQLGYDYMGTIGKLRVWADDIGDTGIAEASA